MYIEKVLREKLKNVILMVQKYYMKHHQHILNGWHIIRLLETNTGHWEG